MRWLYYINIQNRIKQIKRLLTLALLFLFLIIIPQPTVFARQSTVQRVTSLLADSCDLDALIKQNHVTVKGSVEYMPRTDLLGGVAYVLSLTPEKQGLLEAKTILEQDSANGYYLTACELYKLSLAYLSEQARAEDIASSRDGVIYMSYHNGWMGSSGSRRMEG